ncbi:MAG TPA: translation initiation factor IF-2 associated domain-containing protein, partial [Candidatus Competibacter sp.]|nr:translation initiation factor IF-2 associated domain-containing protein [Candidatus Competibacter sp.]
MADVTVKQFATVVGIPVDRLLEQFADAGIAVVGAGATITEKQKVDLLAHLRKSHGGRLAQGAAEPKKITLKRKTHSEIKMAGGMAGQVKTVSIEVRKKRTYVKRSLVEEEATRFREPETPQADALALTAPAQEMKEQNRANEVEAASRRPEELPPLGQDEAA